MKLTRYIVLLIVLCTGSRIFAQSGEAFTIDTIKVLLDENLEYFITELQTKNFKTFKDKKDIPFKIRCQLNCLTKDGFSLANQNEDYRCCCTSSSKLPTRKLLFFCQSKDIFAITYLTGGFGESTTILLLKLNGEKIVDMWSGLGFPEIKSKKQLINFLRTKPKRGLGFHSGYISL